MIAESPALQERAQAKLRNLITALAAALRERGVPEPQANLAAQMGMAALAHAFASGLESAGALDQHLVGAFREVRDLSSSGKELARSARAIAKARSRRAS